MIILGLDCALDFCSVAITRNGELIAQKSIEAKNNQAEILPILAKEVIEQSNFEPNQINRVAVTVGPGSFTGVRIGLSFAKSFALALNIPCIGISCLEVFAAQSAQVRAIPIINIAGSVFMAAFDGRKMVLAPQRFENFDQLPMFENDWVLCGQGAPAAQQIFSEFQIVNQNAIDAYILCTLGAHKNMHDAQPNPQYLRGADAKLWSGFKSHKNDVDQPLA